MTEAGYAWIVTEQALDADNVPEGILGLQLVNATDERAHIKDSMYANCSIEKLNLLLYFSVDMY